MTPAEGRAAWVVGLVQSRRGRVALNEPSLQDALEATEHLASQNLAFQKRIRALEAQVARLNALLADGSSR